MAGDHKEPKRAKKYQAELVTPFAPCLVPNTATPELGIPACSPVQPLDTVCGLDPAFGKGKLKAQVRGGDVYLSGDVRHFIDLDPNDGVDCLGQVLTLVTTSRLTKSDCISGMSCTTVDFGLPIGNCTIDERGNCRIKSSVNSLLPGALVGGASTGIEVLGCSLTRITGAGSPTPTLACGVLVK